MSRIEKKIIECAKQHAAKKGFDNFKVIDVYRCFSGFPYMLEVKYDWIEPDRGIDFPEFENTWYCGFTGEMPCFIY